MTDPKPSNILDGRIDDFASSLPLFERMETALRLRLQTCPNDEKILRELAACKRKQGKLDEALEIYSSLAQQYPNRPDYPYAIAALTTALNGTVSDAINRPCLSPIMEWQNFLPEQTIQEMIRHMHEHKADFRPAEVGGGKDHEESRYNPDARNNTDLSLKGNPLKKQVRELIAERLSEMTRQLGLAPFEASRTEVKLRAYHNGEYFRVHQDGGKGRQISYTYFFHPEPQHFDGGELVLFDTDTKASSFNHSFTRIFPKRNSAFFFPSHFYHAVLPVETQDDDFMSARFVINGHIWGNKDEKVEES
ncbi:2OG-Fe(II) oxygenase [Leucothrix pacifica]|uniref:Prolyl 4-hydroxylase alpha subunit domain-containing protein n=1 Tax=Leucothrix pacifica TaxID=1247513 RepID=A0A317C7G5_9GAMM|nr:2OG-Fe(II) oxygenase [Leucothrix pacifica]PWQ92012.1 hypothetical protein DKW60_23390 [Leucothrix pacifica]